MIVGTDSYITLEEANDYVEAFYTSNDPYRVAWNALNDSDKEIILRNGARAIDSLVLLGRKVLVDQIMEFPRIIRKPFDYCLDPTSYEVPTNVKYAQVEVALSSIDTKIQNRKDLINAGVTSFRIGDLSENYSPKSDLAVASKLYYSSKAVQLMTDYIGGTCRVE